MSNTRSNPFRTSSGQDAPISTPQGGPVPTDDGAAIASSPSENDIVRAIRCVSVWINRSVGSDELFVTMRELGGKLDEILERLPHDRMSGQLMSVKAAAQFLSISERTIRERIATRQWPAYRSGNAVRVDPLELKSLMAKEAR